MRNIKFIVFTLLAAISTTAAAQTKTYTFDDGVSLETDWEVKTEVPDGGTATCEISSNIGGSLVVKDGNYLGLAYLNKSGISISVTTKAQYTNITSIGMDACANDNSKPAFSAYIVDAAGTIIETLFENEGSKNFFETGGSKKWGHKEGISVSGKTGYLKIHTSASSSGKYAAIDNISIVCGGSSTQEEPSDQEEPEDPDEPSEPEKPSEPTPSEPSGNTYALWQFSGVGDPVAGSSESGTKMTVEFLTSDETRPFSSENAKYTEAVPEDMKSKGDKGIKMGSNVLYLKVTIDGGFKAGDNISICGYLPWKISSTEARDGDVAASIATGTDKNNYQIGTYSLTADYEELYFSRAELHGTGIAAIKVERAGGSSPEDPSDPEDPDQPVDPEDMATYLPRVTQTFEKSTTVYATEIKEAGNPKSSWVVVPTHGFSGLYYTNVNDDAEGNPKLITDNLKTTDKKIDMLQLAKDGNYTDQKRIVIMRVKGITGVIGHGVTSIAGRGLVLGLDAFSSRLTKPTVADQVIRHDNAGSMIVSAEGLDPEKEYVVSFYAAEGSSRLYAVEFITPIPEDPEDPEEPVVSTSYLPMGVMTFKQDSIIYADDIKEAGDASTDWVVVPNHSYTGLYYTNVSNDPEGNPNLIIDNIKSTNNKVNMIQLAKDGNYTDQKRIVTMHVKGITGVIGHGSTSFAGRGLVLGLDEYSPELTQPTVANQVVRKNTDGSILVSVEGLDSKKEYIVSIYAAEGNTRFYAVEFMTPEDPEDEDEEPEEPLDPSLVDGLETHMPDIYSAKSSVGGYDTETKKRSDGDEVYEYEVYYAGRSAASNVSLLTTPGDKKTGIEDTEKATATECTAKDGWLKAAVKSVSGSSSTPKTAARDEFSDLFDEWKMAGTSVKMHIKGYDRFAFYAADKNVELKDGSFKKEQRFQVFIDGEMQPEDQCSTDATVRRYELPSSGEHVIEVKSLSGGESKFYGFSLRVAKEPVTRYLRGNDSTQVIKQTLSPKPIYYYTKNPQLGETKLVWDGPKARGIELRVAGSNELGDTLVIGGQALCPTGVYNYHIVSRYNNRATSRLYGTLTVVSEITTHSDTLAEGYTDEEINPILFNYYALSAENIHVSWPDGDEPGGIEGNGADGIYMLSGIPAKEGTFRFIVTVDGGNSISGRIDVKQIDMTNDPILYLYKNKHAYENDGVYTYLLVQKKKNLIARTAKETGARKDYSKYKMVIISEDADADNAEVLAIARGAADRPVLNMKGFSYSEGRLGWGEPDNGTVGSKEDNYASARSIIVERPDHPIFKQFEKKPSQGERIEIFDQIDRRGVMPILVNMQGSMCLATAHTRDREDYYADGQKQTVIHEIPSLMRGGQKYICLPIAMRSTAYLNRNGQQLIDGIMDYLMSDDLFAELPILQMNSFYIDTLHGVINQTNNTIELSMSLEQFQTTYDSLRAVVPSIKLQDELTHVVDELTHVVLPAAGDTMDLRYATFIDYPFVVTDYINRREYTLHVRTYSSQDIEATYEAGQWVNIFDIYGRKVSTTNEDIYTAELPQGVYIVVTENGQTLKIMR